MKYTLRKLFGWRYDKIFFIKTRALLLRLALGNHTFDYMLRSIKNDKRTPNAKLVDIVVRQDGREVRTEADWVKKIAKIVAHTEPKRR
jgi:hypothetical protein